MAITITQHKFTDTSASANTAAVTLTSTGASKLLVVLSANTGARTVTSVTDNKSNSYTQFPSAAINGANSRSLDCWYCAGAISGVTTVTVHYSGSAGTFEKVVEVWEVAGFTSPATDGTASVGTGTCVATTATGASVTTTRTVGFVAAIIVVGGAIAANPASGNEFTSGGDITSNANAACSLISTTAAGHQPVWTDNTSSDAFTTITVAFKESSNPNVTVNVTGLSLTASVGTTVVAASAQITSTGSSVSITPGSVSETGAASVGVTGASLTAAVNSATESGTAGMYRLLETPSLRAHRAPLEAASAAVVSTGTALTASVGSTSETGSASVAPSGSTLTASAGSTSEAGTANLSVSGISATRRRFGSRSHRHIRFCRGNWQFYRRRSRQCCRKLDQPLSHHPAVRFLDRLETLPSLARRTQPQPASH